MSVARTCAVEECSNKHYNRGYCTNHFKSLKKSGVIKNVKSVHHYEYHGMTKSPEHRIWMGIVYRVENPNCPEYTLYGGRGIKMCDRWRSSFLAFYQDMGEKPAPLHSIDRVNNNGDYEPGNCVWATKRQQSINRRRRSDNKTGFTGVYPYRDEWKACISVNGRLKWLGRFKTKEEAVNARHEAELQHYSDVLNR